MLNDLEWLCDWYRQQCDGDWEHEFGVAIDTLDNPGWSLRIDLAGTQLTGVPFAAVESEDGGVWFRLWKDDAAIALQGAGSPEMLPVMLGHFRRWVTENADP